MSGVSMDGIRHQLVNAYRSLCNTLNNSIRKDVFESEQVILSPEEIQEEMDSLRELIAVSCCVFSDKEEHFNMIRDEVGDIPHFNYKEDERDDSHSM